MAEMNMLEIVQEFCRRRGLPIHNEATTASDDTTQQMIGLLNEGIQDIVDRYYFESLIQGVQFNHADQPGGRALDLAVVYPDFKALVANSLWDVTNRTPVIGPLTLQQWAQLQILTPASGGGRYYFTMAQRKIWISPVPSPTASVSFFFFYISRCGVWDPVHNTLSESYTSDVCYPRIPATIVLADLKWRWERDRGFPYAEDQRACEEMITNLVGREPGQELDMANSCHDAMPGLYIPAGSWQVS